MVGILDPLWGLVFMVALVCAGLILYLVWGRPVCAKPDEEKNAPLPAQPTFIRQPDEPGAGEEPAEEDLESTIMSLATPVDEPDENGEGGEKTIFMPNTLFKESVPEPQTPGNLEVPGFILAQRPQPFGAQLCWLAMADTDAQEIAAVMELDNMTEASWSQGLDAAGKDGGQVFITPSLGRFTLVIGRALWRKLDLDQDIAANDWFRDLGQKTRELHFYSTTRELDNHAWAKVSSGRLERAYAYSGELDDVVWDYGEPTAAEKSLRFHFPGFPSSEPGCLPTERDVIKLAALWSVDTSFTDSSYPPSTGYVADLQ